MAGKNLYKDPDGNSVRGRYVYHVKNNNRFVAQCKYPEGYRKTSLWDTVEEAIDWVDSNWDKYKTGFYYDLDGAYRRLRKVGEPRAREQGGSLRVPEV